MRELRLARATAKSWAREDQGLIYSSTKTASQLCPRDSSHTCLTWPVGPLSKVLPPSQGLKVLALELRGSRFDSQLHSFLVMNLSKLFQLSCKRGIIKSVCL